MVVMETTLCADGTTNAGSDKIHGGLGEGDTISVTATTVFTTTDDDIKVLKMLH